MESEIIDWLVSPQADNIVQIANSVIVFCGFLIAAFQLAQNRKIHSERLDWEKKNLTVNALEDIKAINAVEVTGPFDLKNREKPIPLDEIIATLERKNTSKRALTRYLNYYERIAFFCRTGIYDKKIILELRGSIILRAFISFEEYIHDRREERGNQNIYKQLELFVKSLDAYSEYKKSGSIPKETSQGAINQSDSISLANEPREPDSSTVAQDKHQ
mgnify:CR=1 FL=1